jgi:HEAT repeat protein
MAATAIAGMMYLVLARLFTKWRARRLEDMRAILVDTLLAWFDGKRTDDEAAASLTKYGKAATSLIVEVFELVKDDQQRLAQLADRCGIPQHLRELLARGSSADRFNTAEALNWFPSPETSRALVAALDDASADVAFAAAASLANTGEPLPLASFLKTRLRQGSDSLRHLEMVLVLVAPRQADDLIRLAADGSSAERVRVAAINALARTGLFDFVAPISLLASDHAPAVRAAVAHGLGVFAHPAGSEAVTKLLDDTEWEVRAEAAEAAGRIGLTDVSHRLSGLLEDKNWWVRFRAGTALVALGERGIEALRAIAGSSKDLPRGMAALILAEQHRR